MRGTTIEYVLLARELLAKTIYQLNLRKIVKRKSLQIWIWISRVEIHLTFRNLQAGMNTFNFHAFLLLSCHDIFVIFIISQSHAILAKTWKIYKNSIWYVAFMLYPTIFLVFRNERNMWYLIRIIWWMGFYHATKESPEASYWCPRLQIDTLKLHDTTPLKICITINA